MKYLSLIAIGLFAFNTWASQDLGDEMDQLGANKAIMLKAQAIDPTTACASCQNRLS